MNNRRLTPRITPADWMATPPAVKELLNHFVELATEIELARTQASTPDDPSQTLLNVQAGEAGQKARLVLVTPQKKLAPIFPLDRQEVVLGRKDRKDGSTPDINLAKYDKGTLISRRHARIFVTAGTYYLEDLGSLNGTIVSGTVLTRLRRGHPQALVFGDEILVGVVKLRFVQA
ncbi:MAG: FHA domain-containing protein [Blastocatellia bacterium]|nr:FHA domain-containing protein [Blastocatellia bacterium]